MGTSWPVAGAVQGGGLCSGRVAVVSKGEVLRSQQRPKDRPPDPNSLSTLR